MIWPKFTSPGAADSALPSRSLRPGTRPTCFRRQCGQQPPCHQIFLVRSRRYSGHRSSRDCRQKQVHPEHVASFRCTFERARAKFSSTLSASEEFRYHEASLRSPRGTLDVAPFRGAGTRDQSPEGGAHEMLFVSRRGGRTSSCLFPASPDVGQLSARRASRDTRFETLRPDSGFRIGAGSVSKAARAQ